MTEGGKRQIATAVDSSIKVTLKYDGLKDGEQIKYNINNKVKKDSILYSDPFPVKAKSLINVAVFNKDGNIIPGTENSLQIYKINEEFDTKEELAKCINRRIADSSIGLEGDYNDIGLGEIKDLSELFLSFKDSGLIKNSDKFNGDITAWDTSKVTNMKKMFYGAKEFNRPLNFDTSNVTDMSNMFYGATKFNQPLNFNTSNVTDMNNMFNGAKEFNQPLNFNTSNVTDMNNMFYGATKFNQPLGKKFNTEKVTNMVFMFGNAESFNRLLHFNTSNVTDMSNMFNGAKEFNQPLNFDTSNVTNMSSMFSGATKFNQPLGSKFNTSKVLYMENMFFGAKNFDKPLNFNVSNVLHMQYMFHCTKKFNHDISKWQPKNVLNMNSMFDDSVYSHSLVKWKNYLRKDVTHDRFNKNSKLTDKMLPFN